MNPRLLHFGFVAAALLAVCSLALFAQTDKTPVFTTDVSMVHLLVTVRTPEGRPTGEVRREEFQVYDNGVPQEIAVFDERSGMPLSVALLLDTSGSTRIKLKSEKDSVKAYLKSFFDGGNRADAVSLFSFNWQVTQTTRFTRNFTWLDRKLTALTAEAGTSLYDAIYLAAKELDKRDGRRVMLVVTDGADTVSETNFQSALHALHDADTVLYGVLTVPVEAPAGRNIGGENALFNLATYTGGKMFTTGVGPAMDGTFAEILRDLRTQYFIGYYPKDLPPTRETFHQLKVDIKRPGYTAQYRTGYYGEATLKTGVFSDKGPKNTHPEQ